MTGRRGQASRDRAPLLGIGAGVLAVLCCVAGPIVLGAAAGSLVGGALEVVAVVLVVSAVVLVACWWRDRRGAGC